MSQQMNRTVSAQESTISQDESPVNGEQVVEPQYECAICINWLNDPMLTSCGHRFCRKCIMTWLKKPNSLCPIDNKLLSERDIFPDNYTRREIQNIQKPCTNAQFGCVAVLSPLDMESHIVNCEYQERYNAFECLFKKYGCDFVGSQKKHLEDHLKTEFVSHLNFLTSSFEKLQPFNSQMKTLELWDAPSKTGSVQDDYKIHNDNLIKELFQRIVLLEQTNRELNIKIERMSQPQFVRTNSTSTIDPRYSQGVMLWKITQFRQKLDMMCNNLNSRFYSDESYTSPYGYKFCARLNISPKSRDTISLYFHLMQSENDFHLDWPFKGRIKIILIHPKDVGKSRHDTIMSNPEILAFHRPAQGTSPRGFGFPEYACIDDIMMNEFVYQDTLTIKIQVNIV